MRRRTAVTAFFGLAAVVAWGVVGRGQQGAGAAPPQAGPPIRLEATTFVPTAGGAPAVPADLAVAGYATNQRGYYLVQFVGPVRDEWKGELESIGAELLNYVPDFTFKVRMTPAEAAQAGSQSNVAWVGLFQPAYKLGTGVTGAGQALYTVRVERGAVAASAAAEVSATGAQIVQRSDDIFVVSASGGQVRAIARVLDVASVEVFRLREKHNEYAAGVILGSALANGNGYDGSTQTVAVADTGLGNGTANDPHLYTDLGNRVSALFNWPGANTNCYSVTNDGPQDVDSGHGTHVALSVLGAGDASGVGRAAAPSAHLVFQAVENWARMKGLCALMYPNGYYLVGIPADVRGLFQQAYDAGARIHSNSWGSNAAGDYTLDSVNTDSFVWANPDMTITFSAGNAGTDGLSPFGVVDADSIGSPATAKNAITVGASENDRGSNNWDCDQGLSYTNCSSQGGQNSIFTYGAAWPLDFPFAPISSDTSAGNAEQMAAFSSRGPTDDGRIKPDVVAPGTWVVSGYSDKYQQGYDPSTNPQNGLYQYDGWGFPRDEYYKYMGGTSMSNPIVAGAAAVVRDYYQKEYAHAASAALVKADLINSAVDLLDENNDGANDNDYPIPNIHEGWGRVNLVGATSSNEFEDSTVGLGTGGSATYGYSVAGGAPFKVTLVWSDYPSTENAGANLVNDLDLVVSGPGGVTYYGNVFGGGWSQSGGTADRVNNVENVYVQSAAAGDWTVTVSGFNVPNGPQPFALVVRGGTAGGGTPNTAPTAGPVAPALTDEDEPVLITLSGSDAETCELQFSIVSGPSHGSVSGITNDTCSGNSDTATVTYTPTANYNGADSFSFRVNDGITNSLSATVDVTVNAVNDAPVANNDAYGVQVGGALSIGAPGVLSNDNDIDGDLLETQLVSGPAHASAGTFVLNADGSFNYTHDGGTSTSDSFTYTAYDGTAGSNVATVTITITALPGEATTMHVANVSSNSVNNGSTWTAEVTIAVVDNNSDPVSGVTVNGVWSSGSGEEACVTGVNGSCTVSQGDIRKRDGSVDFAIGSLIGTLSYEPNDNVASSITVNKP